MLGKRKALPSSQMLLAKLGQPQFLRLSVSGSKPTEVNVGHLEVQEILELASWLAGRPPRGEAGNDRGGAGKGRDGTDRE